MTVYQDSFDRADNTDHTVDAPVTWIGLTNSAAFDIASNLLARSTSTGVSYIRSDEDTGSADMYARIDVESAGTLSNTQAGPLVRMPTGSGTAAATGYMAMLNWSAERTLTLRKSVANTRTDLSSSLVVTGVIPATVETRASGSTITGWLNGVEELTVTDTSITTGSRGGLYALRQHTFDNYETGALSDLGGGGPAFSGGSTATVTATAEGVGTGARTGGSTTSPTVSSEGAGSSGRVGGSTSSVAVGGQGSGSSGRSGGSTTGVTVTSEGAGQAAVAGQGGSTASLTVTSLGAGTGSRFGGSTSSLTVTPTGGGTSSRSGGSTATVVSTATGAGTGGASGAGASTATVTVDSIGAGLRAASGGAEVSLLVAATSAGVRSASGGSTAAVQVSASGAGVDPTAPVFLPPLERTRAVEADSRLLVVHAESRTRTVPADSRTVTVR